MTDHARAIEAGARADLLPCPFCGAEARFSFGGDGEVVNVRCSKWEPGNCLGAGPNTYSETTAAAAWNTRAIASGELVPASAVAAERERCAALIDAECERILSKQTPEADPLSTNEAINSNLPMMAVLLPDLAAAIRALSPAPASGEFVVVPSFKVGDRVTHTGQESGTVTSTENGCVVVEFDIPTPRGYRSVGSYDAVWFRTHPNVLTKDGELK